MKKFMILGYLALPVIFFFIPIAMYWINDGGVIFHFYTTIEPKLKHLYAALLYYLVLGLIILYNVIKLENQDVRISSKYDIAVLTSLLTYLLPFGYLKMIALPIFIILTGNSKLKNLTKGIIIIIGFITLIFQGQRYLLIFAILISFKEFLFKQKIINLLAYSILGLIVLIFVLEPLKTGEIFSNYSYNFLGIIQHLQPIYVTTYVAIEIPYEVRSFFIESIPLFKSFFGFNDSVELLADEILPPELIYQGNRVGSTSSIFFKPLSFFIAILTIFIVFFFIRKLNFRFLNNSILHYLFIFSPYFIRRSFSTFLIDILLIIILLIPFKIHADYKNRYL